MKSCERDQNRKHLSRQSEKARAYVKTPPYLVDFMVELANPLRPSCRVIEPACGEGPFLKAFAERYGPTHHLWGIDIYGPLLREGRQSLPQASLIEGDFLLWQPPEPFDIVIGNPPYGIIGHESHYPLHVFQKQKALYRSLFYTWQGKYNMYAAFIEKSVRILGDDGKAVLVIPASWLVLSDFSKLRTFLARSGRLKVYYLGKAFPGRNVSCVVLVLEKQKHGLELYEGSILHLSRDSYKGEIIRFETPEILEFEQSSISLGEVFDIYFAARSPEFRKNPYVSTQPKSGFVPVLTGRNLKPGRIDYETCYSALWMAEEKVNTIRFFYGFPHIVVAHTKGTRVVAALDERGYPWREEFHLVPKVKKIDLQAVVEYLNSDSIQAYVKQLYRDFVPHLTSEMLLRIPIPYSFGVRRSRLPL